jgi:hypothetical protein
MRYAAEKERLDALQSLQSKRDATLSALREAEARCVPLLRRTPARMGTPRMTD